MDEMGVLGQNLTWRCCLEDVLDQVDKLPHEVVGWGLIGWVPVGLFVIIVIEVPLNEAVFAANLSSLRHFLKDSQALDCHLQVI